MEEIVRNDIIKILGECLDIIERNALSDLDKISNHTIHNASIFQDAYSISIAVVIASLSKIAKKTDMIDPDIVYKLKQSKECLEQRQDDNFCEMIKHLTDYLKESDDKVHAYIKEVVSRAQLKKGTKIYDHGISIARASELLGISQWELMNYIGKTDLIDKSGEVKQNLEEKLSFMRALFSLDTPLANAQEDENVVNQSGSDAHEEFEGDD